MNPSRNFAFLMERTPALEISQILEKRLSVPWPLLSALRFLLALVVVFFHLDIFFGFNSAIVLAVSSLGGKAAVVAFLFLSGFSIAGSLLKHPDSFFRRRVYRIYPAYLFALICTGALGLVAAGGVDLPGRRIQPSSLANLLAHVFFLQTFLVSAATFNVALWSIAIEMAYYALARVLLTDQGLKLARLFALISVVSFATPEISGSGVVLLVLTKLKFIKYYWCWHAGFEAFCSRGNLRCLGLSALACGLAVISEETPERFSLVPIAIATLSSTLRTNFHLYPRVKSMADVLGDVSYPLYQLHLPAFMLMWQFGVRNIWMMMTFACLSAFATTWAIEWGLKPRYLKRLGGMRSS